MDKLIESLITSGIPAIVIIVGLYFGKNLIQHFFNETIELKKKELEQENKNFQHQLDAKLQEFNIQFSSLHSERANVIKNLYFKLNELQTAMFLFTREGYIVLNDAEKEEKERIERVNKAIIDFSNHFVPNKIYFSKSIINKIDFLFREYWDTGHDFARVLRELKHPPTYNKDHDIDKWGLIADKVEKEFPPLIEELENDFREILGVKN